jgi:hypothetical protein
MTLNVPSRLTAFVHGYRVLFLIFIIALLFRLIHFSQSTDNPLLYQPVLDEAYYIDLGRSIAGGSWQGEERIFFMDPLYGYLLGLTFYGFGDNLTTIRLLQIVLDSLNAVFICLLGIRVWSRAAGVIGGIIYALYKVAFFYNLLILKTTLSVTLFLLFILAVLHISQSRKTSPWIFLGMMGAVMTYLRANFMLILPLTLLFYPVLSRPGWGHFFKHAFLFFAGACLIFLPGLLRNYWVSGEWVLSNPQFGRLLYSCNNRDNLSGLYNVPPFSRPHPEESERDFHREAERRLGRVLSVREVSRYWTKETIRYLHDNPKSVPVLLLNKAKGSIGDHEIPVNRSFYVEAGFSEVARWPLPTFAFAFSLGLPGLIFGIAKRREVGWLLIPVATVLITMILFYASSRFRMPAVPFLIIGVGISLVSMFHWLKERSMAKVTGFMMISVLLFLSSLMASEPRENGTGAFYLAKAYWEEREFKKSEKIALEGLDRYPGQARFHTLLGMIALSENRLEDALRYNQEAIRIDPRHGDAYHNLAVTYLVSGRPERAMDYAKTALTLQTKARFFFTLARAHDELGKKDEALRLFQRFLKQAKTSDPYRETALKRIHQLSSQER